MAKDKIYVGAVGTEILLDAGQNISGAAVAIKVIKPGGGTATWTAAVYNSNCVRHITVESDLNESGDYKVNPQIALADGSWSSVGATGTFHVYNEGE